MFVWACAVFVVDELEEEQVEHDDDGGDGEPEYRRQPTQAGTRPKVTVGSPQSLLWLLTIVVNQQSQVVNQQSLVVNQQSLVVNQQSQVVNQQSQVVN